MGPLHFLVLSATKSVYRLLVDKLEKEAADEQLEKPPNY